MTALDTPVSDPGPRPKPRGDSLLLAVVIVAALYWAQGFFAPLAVTLVVGLALTPLLEGLRRLGLHRALATALCILLCLGILVAGGWLITGQVASMARNLPRYREQILLRIRSLGPFGGLLEDSFSRFEITLSRSSHETPSAPQGENEKRAPSGENGGEDHGRPFETLKNLAGTLLGTLGNLVIVLILLAFFLANREDLRDRLLRVLNARGIPLTRAALTAAGEKISKYVLTEICVNTLNGVALGLGTRLFGLPHPLFWGLMGALFRFIPYVGTWLVAAMALVLSLSLTSTWTRPLLLLVFWIVVEVLTADVIEPLVYGRRTGMTPLGVMISALLWSWLWGIPGLIIATPLTAALVQLGAELPALNWLHGLFSAPPRSEIRAASSDSPHPEDASRGG